MAQIMAQIINQAPNQQTQNTCELTIPPEHPSYAGHFPGYPIVPGVVCLSLAIAAIEGAISSEVSVQQLNAVKFTAPIFPGDALIVEYTLTASKLNLSVIKQTVKALSVTATLNREAA